MGLQLGVALPVALERRTGVVEAPAVELGDDAVLQPVAVDEVPVHHDVRPRPLDPVSPAEDEHRRLEVAAGVIRLDGEELREPCRPGASGRGGERAGAVEEPQRLRRLHGAGERGRLDGAGEVAQGARDAGDRDPLEQRDVLRAEAPAAMHDQAGAPRASARPAGHVHGAAGRGAQIPQRRGVRVAQHRALAERADRGEPPPALRQPPMSHRVHPAVQRDQPPAPDPLPDLRPRSADRVEPGAVDDPVVGVRERGDPLVQRSLDDLSVHTTPSSSRGRFAPLSRRR